MSTNRAITALIVLVLVTSASGVFSQEPEIPDPVTIEQLNDHLYAITCTGGHMFGLDPYGITLIASVGEDGILLVDAGFLSTGESLRDTLAVLGDGNVRMIINTHCHGDHTMGNRFFRLRKKVSV